MADEDEDWIALVEVWMGEEVWDAVDMIPDGRVPLDSMDVEDWTGEEVWEDNTLGLDGSVDGPSTMKRSTKSVPA